MSETNLLTRIKEEFNNSYPAYKKYFTVKQEGDNVTMELLGWTVKFNIKDMEDDPPVEGDMTTDDVLWLNITTIMANLVENVQRGIVRDGLDELKEMIQKNILSIAESANMDINTLWLSFECTMDELKNDFKKLYK